MLLQSITAGLRVLCFWQTYAVALAMVAIMGGPKLYLALLKDRGLYGDFRLSPRLIWYLIQYHWISRFEKLFERAGRCEYAGGLFGLLTLAFAEALGCYFAVLTLLPIMLRTGTGADWSLPWTLPLTHPRSLAIAGAGLLAASAVAFKIPVLGRMLFFPATVAALAWASGTTHELMIPGFWLLCGIILSGFAAKYLAIGILVAVEVTISSSLAERPGFAAVAMATQLSISTVLNLLGAFFYAGWMSHAA